jgi:GMP synthase-like glutamine amidotransferase
MSVLVFRHIPFEGLGLIAPTLTRNALDFKYIDAHSSQIGLVNITAAQALIFMGGPMSANDDLPYLHQEIELIRSAYAAGIPMLGICLGSQLIAKALGGSVYRNPVKEIGWFPIEFTDAARQDPLFSQLEQPETVFHWHSETFDLPPGAELLAHSVGCRHQAFRLRDNVYGLQFHLEVTPAMIADWCDQDANCGDVRELASPIDPNFNSVRLQELSSLVFGRWCTLVSDCGRIHARSQS